ncbi:MAG: type II secretion system protein [Dokdonella sp.]|uniref:type IV pilus modification PilV family protein n=1 Tax=Dokdonella sp. TaxID=2291710 RepID=UPI0032632E32
MNRLRRQPTLPVRGFSLIEMIAAFLVFAIAMGVLMQVLATAMRATRQSSDYTMAALWAQSKLDTVGVGQRIEAGHSNGRFDDSYRWQLDIDQVDPSNVEPPPQTSVGVANINQPSNANVAAAAAAASAGVPPPPPFDLYQIDLTVIWGADSALRSRSAHFGTLRAQNPDPNANQGTPPGQPGAGGQGATGRSTSK